MRTRLSKDQTEKTSTTTNDSHNDWDIIKNGVQVKKQTSKMTLCTREGVTTMLKKKNEMSNKIES